MKSAITLVPNPLGERKELTTALAYGVEIPPIDTQRREGPIKRKLRAAENGAHFLVYGVSNSHIHKAARAVGVKVETRKLGNCKFGVWVRKPEAT